MSDWAIEKAGHIYALVHDNFAGETPAKICERIAVDLRKARADGMREAAEIVDNFNWTLPLLDTKELNEVTDDTAEAIKGQIGEALAARAALQEKQP